MKGAAIATVGQVLVADGAGAASFETVNYSTLQQGWWLYEDVTTQSTAIALTVAGTWYNLTNDGAGTNSSNSYSLNGYSNIWNVATSRFDFSGLSVGETFEIRFEVEFTTGGANTVVDMEIQFGVGSGLEFSESIVAAKSIKTAGTNKVVASVSFPVLNTTVTNYPALVRAKSDATGTTVKIVNWYIKALANG